MRSWIGKVAALLVLGLFAWDALALDNDLCSPDQAQESVCHNCDCGPHMAPAQVAVVVSLPRPTPHEPYFALVVLEPVPQSIFHPPQALA